MHRKLLLDTPHRGEPDLTTLVNQNPMSKAYSDSFWICCNYKPKVVLEHCFTVRQIGVDVLKALCPYSCTHFL